MILLDSCILIAAFKKGEIHEQSSLDILKSGEILGVPDYVVAETATVLQMRESFEAMNLFLKYISFNKDISIVHTNKEVFSNTLQGMRNGNGKLSFVDRLLVIYHTYYDYKVATYDKEILKIIKK